MTTFDCIYCNYKTERRWDFSKHLRTKKHQHKMESMGIDTLTTFCDFFPPKILQNPPKILQNPPKSSKMAKKSLIGPPKILQNPPKSSDLILKNVEKRPFLKLSQNVVRV